MSFIVIVGVILMTSLYDSRCHSVRKKVMKKNAPFPVVTVEIIAIVISVNKH